MKIGIFGIGAIGSVLSIELSKNKNLECSFFNRSHKERILVDTENQLQELPIQLSNPKQFNKTLDWLIICIKANQYKTAIEDLQLLISNNTNIVVIRNGLNLKEPLLPYSKKEHILECIIDCPSQPIGNGVYRVLQKAIITSHQSPIIEKFRTLFSESDLAIVISSDFKTICWKKVCESSALGAILCLSGSTVWVFEDPEIEYLYLKILEEAIRVAKADGAKIEDDFKAELLSKINNYPKDKGSSMLTDRLVGKPIELEAKNKIISDIGKIYEINTPINDIVCILLKYTNRDR